MLESEVRASSMTHFSQILIFAGILDTKNLQIPDRSYPNGHWSEGLLRGGERITFSTVYVLGLII